MERKSAAALNDMLPATNYIKASLVFHLKRLLFKADTYRHDIKYTLVVKQFPRRKRLGSNNVFGYYTTPRKVHRNEILLCVLLFLLL